MLNAAKCRPYQTLHRHESKCDNVTDGQLAQNSDYVSGMSFGNFYFDATSQRQRQESLNYRLAHW